MVLTHGQILQPVDQKRRRNPAACAAAGSRFEQWCAQTNTSQQCHKCSPALFMIVQFIQRRLDRRVDPNCILFFLSSVRVLVVSFV